jgi:hypothetical protein
MQPMDVVKTRVMNNPGQYSGPLQCGLMLLRNEGVLGLWRGFIPALARLGPQTVLTFFFLEQFKQLHASLQ